MHAGQPPSRTTTTHESDYLLVLLMIVIVGIIASTYAATSISQFLSKAAFSEVSCRLQVAGCRLLLANHTKRNGSNC